MLRMIGCKVRDRALPRMPSLTAAANYCKTIRPGRSATSLNSTPARNAQDNGKEFQMVFGSGDRSKLRELKSSSDIDRNTT